MQQFPFIDLFKSALHVSGDNFAHHQEHFNCIYPAFGTMHRHCIAPEAGYTFEVLLRMGEIIARNM
jgi:hypothetical protein